MQGDFSRSTFDRRRAYRAVLLQQGRVLLDADWNEQAELTAVADEVRTRDVVGASGGPLPDDPTSPGPFAVVAADGTAASATAWADLRVAPGRYTVDGVLAQSWEAAPLGDQPHLRAVGDVPGLPEPPASPDGTRYALYLEVGEHHVTPDEAPELREPALGGPDTTTRAQVVWQVRWERLDAGERCSDLHAASWLRPARRTMVASLRPPEDDPDPCRPSSSGGYTRLENQLYRVQVHDGATFLWSRENGSVVSRLVAITPSALPGVDAVLRLDRVGRDEELSVRQGDLVEVTSSDRALQRLPGSLARAGVPAGLELPVTWLGDAPASLAALGHAPVVRRWEGGPVPLGPDAVDLEDGLQVRFPDDAGTATAGDHWLVPARTVRLAYGLSALRGTVDWPVDPGGTPLAAPPHGPRRHVSPLAVLVRSGGLWSQESDCRRLFPPLTGLVALDLVGGDGQEDLPGEWLDEPVRVVVRNGGVAVGGAPVELTASDGGLLSEDAVAATAGPLVLAAGSDGVVAVRWRLEPGGPTTQTLTARRVDDHGAGVDVAVVVTGRLALAREVAWDHGRCVAFEGVTTVAGALDRLVERPELRLRGGDGQHLTAQALVLPRPVRVLVDSACGPLGGVPVSARASGQARVRPAEEGTDPPDHLDDAGDVADATTGPDGAAQFWWQPDVSAGSDELELRLPGDDPHAPLVVTAQAATGGGGRRGGVHIAALRWGTRRTFANDGPVSAATLATGIVVDLDGAIDLAAVKGGGLARVELDLPWPYAGDGQPWWGDVGERPFATRSITLDADLGADDTVLHWQPVDLVREWLDGGLWRTLEAHGLGIDHVVRGRFLLDGWALPAADGSGHVNTHADAVVSDGRTLLRLPTDDEVTGGTFVQWFSLRREGDDEQVRRVVPEVVGSTLAVARRVLAAAGIAVTEVRTEGLPNTRGRVTAVEPAAGTELGPDDGVVLVVSGRVA